MSVTVTYATERFGADDRVANTDTVGNQGLPDVLTLAGGGYVSAYNSGSTTDGLIDLDFYNSDYEHIGTFQTGYAPGQGGASDAVGQPKLTELSNGDVLVVWADDNQSGVNQGPRAAIFTAVGVPVAQDIDLFAGAIVYVASVDVTALADGGFAMAYANSFGVFVRLYDDAGVQTLPFIEAGAGTDVQIAALSDGAFVMSWSDATNDQLHYRIFEADGAPRTEDLLLNFGASQFQTSLAADNDGGFVVAFTDTGWVGEDQGISLAAFDSAGDYVDSVQVTDGSDADERDPDVTVLPNGFIVVTWTRPFTAGDDDISFRVYDADLKPVTDEAPLANDGDLERDSAVAAFADGAFITSWADASVDGNGAGIGSEITEVVRTVVGDGADDAYIGDLFRDSMKGGFGDDNLEGYQGDDTLLGGQADDTLLGGDGIDCLDGGAGRDLVQGSYDLDIIRGGDGNDVIFAFEKANPSLSGIGDEMHGDDGADKIRGARGDDTANGGTGADKISGGDGADVLAGGEDADKPKGQAGDDTLEGGEGGDTLNGGAGADVLYAMTQADVAGSADADYLNGAQGADTLHGSAGQDVLVGLTGKDSLVGGGGSDDLDGGRDKDVLVGGAGADVLEGGGDKDSFTYLEVADSVAGGEDKILDLGNQDFVDLSEIDAKSGAGNQAFTLVSAFSGARGELVVRFHAEGDYNGYTSIQGDVDGDMVADLVILVLGDRHNFTHFVL